MLLLRSMPLISTLYFSERKEGQDYRRPDNGALRSQALEVNGIVYGKVLSISGCLLLITMSSEYLSIVRLDVVHIKWFGLNLRLNGLP